MARTRQRYVRQMPRIYGNLQPRKRSYFSWLRYTPLVLWSGAFLGLGYLFFFSGFFSVKSVTVEGSQLTNADAIRKEVPLGGSIWFVSKNAITAKLLDDPAVSGVAVLRGIPDSVKVVVQERKPAFVWRSGTIVAVVDDAGIPFRMYAADVLQVENNPLKGLPQVVDTKALPVTLGQPLAGRSFVSFVTAVRGNMATLLPDITVDHFEIVDSTYDVTMVTTQGMRVQFNSLGDAGVQTRNLTRLVHQKKATATSKVDLRVDRWAYVQ